jgi:DNA-binding response OmpR family regulator
MILIVEDDVRLAECIKESLVHIGYEVQYRTSITQAIEYLKTSHPELIICDILLVDNNGFVLLEHIRSMPQFNNTDFIFISALLSSEYVVKALKFGAQDFLRKPFSIKELELRVRNLINRKQIGNDSALSPKILKERIFHETTKIGSKEISNILIKSIETIISLHLSEAGFTSHKLASLLGIKQYKLKSFIKWKYGITLSKFIDKFKMEQSKKILIHNKGNVIETSKAIGLKSTYFFSTKFEDIFKESPLKYYERVLIDSNLRKLD